MLSWFDVLDWICVLFCIFKYMVVVLFKVLPSQYGHFKNSKAANPSRWYCNHFLTFLIQPRIVSYQVSAVYESTVLKTIDLISSGPTERFGVMAEQFMSENHHHPFAWPNAPISAYFITTPTTMPSPIQCDDTAKVASIMIGGITHNQSMTFWCLASFCDWRFMSWWIKNWMDAAASHARIQR